jgi:hypothetical protein
MPLIDEELQAGMDAVAVIESSVVNPPGAGISYGNTEIGGAIGIRAGYEYIAIARPVAWPTPEEACEMKNTVAVNMTLDDAPIGFAGYGPTAEGTTGGIPNGTCNFAASCLVGPFPAGDYIVEAVPDLASGYVQKEKGFLHARQLRAVQVMEMQ